MQKPNCIRISVLSADGTCLALGEHPERAVLVYDAEYHEGDVICLEVPAPGCYVICLEDALGEALVFLKETTFLFPIPFDEARISYNPRAFLGVRHMLTARRAAVEEISARRNWACNVYDHHDNRGCFPHAWANVETRNEAVFAARNAIDGVCCPLSHGRYPYQSWGINKRADAAWSLDLGQPVQAEELWITLRADFPHDAWWTQGTLTIDGEEQRILQFEKSAEPQRFRMDGRIMRTLRLDHLVKAEDPSPFPALTQLALIGRIVQPFQDV